MRQVIGTLWSAYKWDGSLPEGVSEQRLIGAAFEAFLINTDEYTQCMDALRNKKS